MKKARFPPQISAKKLKKQYLMFKEWMADLENARIQSLLDVNQKLKKYWVNQLTDTQRKIIDQKLNHLFKQVDTLLSLKAKFADNQPVIASCIDAIETSLSDIESELAAPLIEPAKLDVLDKKAEDIGKEVDAVRDIIDDWLSRFSKASESKEKSLEDLVGYIPETDTGSDFIKSLEESFGKSNLNFNLEEEQLWAYKEKVDGFGLRIKDAQLLITIRRENPSVFWKLPKPSLPTRKSLEEDKLLLNLFQPRGKV